MPPREFVAEGETGVDAGGAPELLEAPPCSSVAVDNGVGLVLEPEPVVVCAAAVPVGAWDWGGAG